MSFRRITASAIGTLATVGFADDTLYRYDANVVPYDASAGWSVFNPCEAPCSESVEDGHFVLRFATAGDLANYNLIIAPPSEPPPDSLWVEWRFRSNHPIGPNFFSCDGGFWVFYEQTSELLNMYGDAAISFGGDDAIFGLKIDEFHSFRFESVDGQNYRISVDGLVLIDRIEDVTPGTHFLQLSGRGGCDGFQNTVNEWDFVRYGTISFGEQIIAADPPSGTIDFATYGAVDRFVVTFDAANYAYIDDIAVTVTGGDAPIVTQTRRLDNDEPNRLEIVLDRPLTANETTTFTFSDGTATNVVAYTFIRPDTDGDGVFDDEDNCPNHPNPGQADCDNDGIGDTCTIAECPGDPACGDCNGNTVPDACDPDCQPNGTPDECDVSSGSSLDCQPNSIPDECDLTNGTSNDCQPNTVPDECEIASGTSQDCNANDRPDVCDLADGTSSDCQPNAIPDECDLTSGASSDCQANNTPDECDISAGSSSDCDANIVPDECQADIDGDGLIDACDACPREFVNDEDGDGVCFPQDRCPADPGKTTEGICGCGISDVDSDLDAVPDCIDQCPSDPNKTTPGQCGCGVSDVDTDGDTIPDCDDQCPGKDDLVDNDGNNIPDCLEEIIIPTVSGWGLVVLSAALFVTARTFFGRKRRWT